MYQDFAEIYDRLMDNVNYNSWADYYVRLLSVYGVRGGKVCECACGTGNLTIPMQRMGYQMTGADALDYMVFAYEDGETNPWMVRAGTTGLAFYPHLTGFNFKADGTPETDPSQIPPEDWPAKVAVDSPFVSAFSLTLDGDIGVNFYADIPGVTDEAYATFTVDGKTYKVPVKLNEYISTGISFPKARASAIKDLAKENGITGDLDPILSSPNSILAMDYLIALKKLDKKNRINVIMIRREGDPFGSSAVKSNMPSASSIRRIITKTKSTGYSRSAIAKGLNGLMPDHSLGAMLSSNSGDIFSFPDYACYIRDCMNTATASSSLENISYMSDDLAGYIRNMANDVRPGTIPDEDHDLKAFEEKISTKRYTLTRIERALACMITGQDKSYLDIKRPPYIRVLGFNNEGKYCLKIMGKCADIPIITRPSDCLELQSDNNELKRIFELDMRAASIGWRIYGKDTASEWEAIPVIVK